MFKRINLCIFIMLISIILSSCLKFNPVAPPDVQSVNNSVEVEQDKYMDEIDGMLDENEKLTDKKANEFSEQFKYKTDSVYYNAIDKYTTQNTGSRANESPVASFLRGFYSTYNDIRLLSPVIFLVSFVFGIVGILFSKYNKGARRFFLIAFVITIPLLVLVIVFGIGILNDMFLYN